MGYAPTDTVLFKGQLAYHKAFGASPMNPNSALNFPQRGMGFDTFDWISSETLNDDKLRVREAYWLWTPTIGGFPTTFSIGRRPATNGYLANLREDDPKPKSPLAHVINMEFDGASAGIKLDKFVPGMSFKLCVGRGLTNAKSWANQADSYLAGGSGTSPNYIEEDGALDNVDMVGFIFVPYDDGQYAVKTTWYRGLNVPGLYLTDYDFNGTPMDPTDDTATWSMKTGGNIDGMAISGKIDGIGDGINDFLDDTTVFLSYAMSKTDASDASVTRTADAQAAAGGMGITGDVLGSGDNETGNSIWVGAQMPNLTGGRFGIEYNKGSKYWRPFTYGEDTMIGSKLAARGSAYEAYWTQPIVEKVFSMQVRYTKIDYEYTGSDGFFGDGGMPLSMSEAQAIGMDPVEHAQDLRVYFRYRY